MDIKDILVKERFDWGQFISLNDYDPGQQGRQILNFFSTDKPYHNNPDSVYFVEAYLSDAQAFDVDAKLLKFACEQVQIDGAILEMGVCTGRTINAIALLHADKKIYGFDSFEGLPEPWDRGRDLPAPQGLFAYKDAAVYPPVLFNVNLVRGLFSETLPIFKKSILKEQPIAFLHIDCDLYASTRDVFYHLAPNIVPGTILLFDEFYNYVGYEHHEFKAFQEFLNKSHLNAEYIGYNTHWEQVAIRICE